MALSINNHGYLTNGVKLVIVQIGKSFFALQPYFKIKTAKQLKHVLDTYDVRLLKEG